MLLRPNSAWAGLAVGLGFAGPQSGYPCPAFEEQGCGANDPVQALRDRTLGGGAHKTLDCSAAPEGRAQPGRAVRSCGTACYGGEGGNVTIDVSPDMLRRQVTLVGSWTFSKQGQADCAELVADKKIAVDKLFTHRWKLEQAREAYELFDKQTTGKGVIIPS